MLAILVNVDRTMILFQSKDLENTELPEGHSIDVICPQKIERQQRTPVIDGIGNKIKKEEQEVQNILPLKSGGKVAPQNVSCFMNISSIATVN